MSKFLEAIDDYAKKTGVDLERLRTPLTKEQREAIAKYIPNDSPQAPVGRRTRPCVPDCPVCGGFGYVRIAPNADKNSKSFGKVDVCPRVDRLQSPAQAELLGITASERDELGWGALIMDWGNVAEAVTAIKSTLERGWGFVYLWGDYGMAKSLLLRIAVAETMRADKVGAYANMPDIIQHLRRAFREDDRIEDPRSEDERLNFWMEVPLLCVDEVEEMRDTSYAAEKQFMLLNTRHEQTIRERNLVTILASNQPPEVAMRRKLADRIMDGRYMIVHLVGESMRPYLKEKFLY